METGKSPQTPQGRKLVQGRLPFAIVDNKSASKLPTGTKGKVRDGDEEKNDNIKIINNLENDSKKEEIELVSMIPDSCAPTKSEEKTENAPEVEVEESEGEDEMETSICSRDSRDIVMDSPALKKMTPKQLVREQRKEERRREKEEREKKKAEEKAEKERQKREKQEEKRLKEEEKEAEKRKKEEERKKREEEKEAEKKRKEEEKKKKEEEKEAEKRRKEEEKKKKEEEKEAEKRREEEKEKRKKERISQAFTSFFTQKKSSMKTDNDSNSKNIVLAFPPFQVKENMRLAPLVRTIFDDNRKEKLDQIIQNQSPVPKSDLFLFKGHKGDTMGATWPSTKEAEVEVIDEDDAPVNKDDIIITPSNVGRMRAKLLQFGENRRPAYWGTWRKHTKSIGPRRPFGKDDSIFDYEIDSDDEWEEEVEPGESLTDSEGEGEEKEPADDYEVDNEFLVPHGYLSEEEGDKDEDERPLSPSTAKERLKMKEEQFERELKEKTCQIKPSLIGCFWNTDAEQEAQLLKVLTRYAAVVFAPTPISLTGSELVCDGSDSPMVDDPSRSEKMAKRVVSDNDVPVLIRLVHGNAYSRSVIVKEFQLYLERNRSEERNMPPKTKIVAKIAEIASWTKCSETGPMNGRTCWLVHPEVLERYQLDDLSAVNTWEFSTETKKRGRKPDDSKATEDGEETPPSKTARVSLMKKFVQPQNNPVSTEPTSSKTGCLLPSEEGAPPTESSAQDDSTKPKSTPQAKKRIALISLTTSASKKPRNESVATPLTNFLRRMGSKSETSPTPVTSPKQDAMEEESIKDSDCQVLD